MYLLRISCSSSPLSAHWTLTCTHTHMHTHTQYIHNYTLTGSGYYTYLSDDLVETYAVDDLLLPHQLQQIVHLQWTEDGSYTVLRGEMVKL